MACGHEREDQLYDQMMGAMGLDAGNNHSGLVHDHRCAGVMVDAGAPIVCVDCGGPHR